jgi:integrase
MGAKKRPNRTPGPPAVGERHSAEGVTARSRSNRGQRFPPEPLRPGEVDALATACNPRYPSGARNRALIYVLAHSGLRCAEALDLAPKDYDGERGCLRVLRGKGGKHRVVPVSGAAATALAKWFEHRVRLGLSSTVPIFSTSRGESLATSYARALVKRLARRAGIEKRVHVHGLRHSFAIESIRRGVKINVLAKILGHANSATTSRYIDHLGDDDAVEALRRAWDDEGAERSSSATVRRASSTRDGVPASPVGYIPPPIPRRATPVRRR